MEEAPRMQRDEEYPLLKVEGGGGDSVARNQVPHNIAPSVWHVACTPKQSWYSRWPEFMSACWMTIILLAITFLVFYALGMSAYRRQAVVIVSCNETKRASDVYYHHIVSREGYIPFAMFSEYLSYMAKQYPLLRFNIYFLIDDSWQGSTQVSRHTKFLKRLIPHITGYNTFYDQNYKREIKDFQRKYQNVNINIMHLSKYMAMTPLRFKWKTIPASYLQFYARVYSLWEHGGIGFDLATFNNAFHKDQTIDRRVDAILRQHNDGIDTEKYADALRTFDNEEQTEFFSLFFNLINQIINETSSFFDTDWITDVNTIEKNPVVRSHRNKRDVITPVIDTNVTANNTQISPAIKTKNQSSDIFNDTNAILSNTTDRNAKNISTEPRNNRTSVNGFGFDVYQNQNQYEKDNLIKMTNLTNIHSDIPQLLFFYDFSAFSDDIGPSYFLPKDFTQSNITTVKSSVPKYKFKHGQSKSKYLTMTPEGFFMAASSNHHPFLAQLFSAGCQRVRPMYAIKNTLFTQCSGFLRDDIYCENIHVIYNVV